MVRHCVVPGCKTTLRSRARRGYSPVSVFSFPKDEDLRKLWIRAIPRKDFQPGKFSAVCVEHFQDFDIIRNGFGVQLKRPRLVPNAVPCIFPSCPSYLSSPKPPPRKDPDLRRKEVMSREQAIKNDIITANYIINYSNFFNNFATKLKLDGWCVLKSPKEIIFFMIEPDEAMISNFKVRISVCCNLYVRIFDGATELNSNSSEWLLPGNKLTLWSQMNNIISRYGTNEAILDDKIIPEPPYREITTKIEVDETISDEIVINQPIPDEPICYKTTHSQPILDQKISFNCHYVDIKMEPPIDIS